MTDLEMGEENRQLLMKCDYCERIQAKSKYDSCYQSRHQRDGLAEKKD